MINSILLDSGMFGMCSSRSQAYVAVLGVPPATLFVNKWEIKFVKQIYEIVIDNIVYYLRVERVEEMALQFFLIH